MNSELRTYPAEPTVFHRFWIEYELNFYQSIYGWILDSKVFPWSLRTSETEFRRRSYDRLKLEASHKQ